MSITFICRQCGRHWSSKLHPDGKMRRGWNRCVCGRIHSRFEIIEVGLTPPAQSTTSDPPPPPSPENPNLF